MRSRARWTAVGPGAHVSVRPPGAGRHEERWNWNPIRPRRRLRLPDGWCWTIACACRCRACLGRFLRPSSSLLPQSRAVALRGTCRHAWSNDSRRINFLLALRPFFSSFLLVLSLKCLVALYKKTCTPFIIQRVERGQRPN